MFASVILDLALDLTKLNSKASGKVEDNPNNPWFFSLKLGRVGISWFSSTQGSKFRDFSRLFLISLENTKVEMAKPDPSRHILIFENFCVPQSWRPRWIRDLLKSRSRFSVRTAIPTYLAHGWCLSLPKKRMCLLINNYAIDTRYAIENSIWYDNPFLNKLSKLGLRVWLIT